MSKIVENEIIPNYPEWFVDDDMGIRLSYNSYSDEWCLCDLEGTYSISIGNAIALIEHYNNLKGNMNHAPYHLF